MALLLVSPGSSGPALPSAELRTTAGGLLQNLLLFVAGWHRGDAASAASPTKPWPIAIALVASTVLGPAATRG